MALLYFKNNYHPRAKEGPSFTNEISFNHHEGVAYQNGSLFFAISLNEGGSPHFYKIAPEDPITLQDWILKSFGDASPVLRNYQPGTYYKRIWRPGIINTILDETITQSFISLKILLNKLELLFETIEPDIGNLQVYGLKIREVLLLACMEVESGWVAVLKENQYSSSRNTTTQDYFKLCKPMLLDAYEIQLQQYPNYPAFTPFNNWNPARPTASLLWYDAYNKTKHDREANLNVATLETAITAVAAVYVMFHAQFGGNIGLTGSDPISATFKRLFRMNTFGFTDYNKEFYIPNYTSPSLLAQTPQWTAINFNF
jgi:hypothetical protein